MAAPRRQINWARESGFCQNTTLNCNIIVHEPYHEQRLTSYNKLSEVEGIVVRETRFGEKTETCPAGSLDLTGTAWLEFYDSNPRRPGQ